MSRWVHENMADLQQTMSERTHTVCHADFRIAAAAILGIPVRLHCLAKDSTERFSQLVDVVAERLFASAIEVEAWKALD